jgi:hypothetical protein
MRMSLFVVLVAAVPVSSAFGCSIDALQKLSETHLERLPSGVEHDLESVRTTEGAHWQTFERENATPHSIVATLFGETGQAIIQISFMNRKDFVIVETQIHYAEPIVAQNRSGRFTVDPPIYSFFCDGTLQEPSGALSSQARNEANRSKAIFFEATGFLKQELERIPE